MSAAKPVVQVLAAIDDHLQAMQHYGHSHDLREAMNTVGQLQDALAHLLRWHDQLKPADIQRAQAILDKATGSAPAAAPAMELTPEAAAGCLALIGQTPMGPFTGESPADKERLQRLRDEFAMAALPAYFSDGHGHSLGDRSAKWAYDMADAMLKARQS